MRNKKGISPLIATVLIIGFTIVIAALVITWGTNLFRETQERTGETSELNLACADVLSTIDVRVTNLDESTGTFDLTLDNGVTREIDGFIVRVYNAGETSADTVDTADLVGDFTLGGNSLKTFSLNYDPTIVDNVVKFGVKPKVVIKGETKQCQGEATREVL